MKKINMIDALGSAELRFVDEAQMKKASAFFKERQIKKKRLKVMTALVAAVLTFILLTITVTAKMPDDGRHTERSDYAYTTAAAGTIKQNDTSLFTTTKFLLTDAEAGTKPVTCDTSTVGDDPDETDHKTDPVTTTEPVTSAVNTEEDGSDKTLVTPVTDNPLTKPET